MATVFDCMPNHGDCTLTHNKLRWLYYINKNITVTVYNKYKKHWWGEVHYAFLAGGLGWFLQQRFLTWQARPPPAACNPSLQPQCLPSRRSSWWLWANTWCGVNKYTGESLPHHVQLWVQYSNFMCLLWMAVDCNDEDDDGGWKPTCGWMHSWQ